MRYFVINLDKDVDRMKQFNDVFSNSNWGIERINGDYGSYISDSELTSMSKYFATNSQKGCFSSHRKIWQKIVRENISLSLIFEDDCVPVISNYEEEVNRILSEVPEDFDIINLTNSGLHTNTNYFMVLLYKILGIYRNDNKIISRNLCKPEVSFSASSYILSLSGAKKALNYLTKIHGHVDTKLFSCPYINCYGVINSIFDQKYEDSNNLSFVIKGQSHFVNQVLFGGIFQIFGINMTLFNLIILIFILGICSFYYKNKYIFIIGVIILITTYLYITKLLLVY